MNTTILVGHPYEKSFNHKLVDIIAKKTNGKIVNLIDDNFDPVMRGQDLAGFSKGHASDPLVIKYQEILNKTDRLVIVTPIWWSNLPAIYKGFFDKVFLKGYAYDEKNRMLVGRLTHIKEVVVVSTSQAPTLYLKLFSGNPIRVLKKRVFKDVGLNKVKSFHLGSISSISDEKRKNFLDKIEAYF